MTLHHEHGAACPFCDFKATQAHPKMAAWFARIKAKYANVHIAWSYRGHDAQEKAYQEGTTKLHYPSSAHNKTDEHGNPQSRALDLFLLDDDGVARFPGLWYAKLNAENEKNQEPIFWGGRWKAFGDLDHFEYREPVERAPA